MTLRKVMAACLSGAPFAHSSYVDWRRTDSSGAVPIAGA